MKRILCFSLMLLLITQLSWARRAEINTIATAPYVSALAVDADSGKTLFEENGGAIVYPASVVKLMVLLVVLDRVEQGTLKLAEMVQVSKEAARIGGSQVYLDPKEAFSIEDLLYALIVQSANDAAVALAIHVAGSKEEFVSLMNQRAHGLGMKDTTFYSVHGLPPSEGQKPDQSTARDLALLGLELAKKPEVFKYTGTREREFRGGEFILRTHNHLLETFAGCDGFKTGYFKAAGFSVIATAERNGVRIIAIVMGSEDRKVRDATAAELLRKGFAAVKPRPQAQAIVSKPEQAPEAKESSVPAGSPETPRQEEKTGTTSGSGPDWMMFLLGVGTGLLICLALSMVRAGSRSRKPGRLT